MNGLNFGSLSLLNMYFLSSLIFDALAIEVITNKVIRLYIH